MRYCPKHYLALAFTTARYLNLLHTLAFLCLFENLERPAGRIGLDGMGWDGMDGAHGKTAENIVWDTMFSINHSYVLVAGSELRGFLGEERRFWIWMDEGPHMEHVGQLAYICLVCLLAC